ncbi:uncharacterized protein LOC111063278 [Nilaparvata lugens]|uniref:uncharacterized protein LOC111063278 n=1 Tax=Nilaparvata lugens TaxID=108931 RepID=UPI00193D7212|nr:uncharacterized protein LOC111063278 [Nilaparvata lugens]
MAQGGAMVQGGAMGSQEPEFEEQQRENDNEESVEQSQTSNSKDNNESVSTPPPEDAFTSPKTPIKKRKVRSTSAGSAPIINEAVNLLKSIQSKKKEKDEYDSFGEQVAIKLRKITSTQARFEAQQIINKKLFEAEMGMSGYSYNAITHIPISCHLQMKIIDLSYRPTH